MRVEVHPATDSWMRGDRYGEVVAVGRVLVHVRMDRSETVRQFSPENIHEIVER